jgi:S1-C subfamily serine protease
MLSAYEDDVIRTIEKVGPSVVNINTIRLVHDYYMNIVPLRGMGSGIIFDPSGLIMTNNHIIEEAEKIEVTLFDGRKFDGKLVGTDKYSDIAIVKVEGGNLPAAELGDSSEIRVGQTAVAIGNPFGFFLQGPTVTVGVISALHRTIQAEQGVFENLMQTDAHINPGNSGGPLVNIKGQIIGINSANIPFAQGIGFSIPITAARHIADELIKHGKVIRPWLGILGIGLNPQIAEYYRLPADRGILVTRVFENSPAFDAGIAPGDLIVEADHKDVNDMGDLTKEIRTKNIGDEVSVVVQRGPQKGEIQLRLAESPS